MMHESKIRKITVRVEFQVDHRIGYVEADVDMSTLCNAPRLRAALDESMNNFLMKHLKVPNSSGIQ